MRSFRPNARLAERAERIGQEFLAEFLGRAVVRQPGNLSALVELGHVLTRLGRHEEGLVVDRRLERMLPDDPTVQYNLACSLALLNHPDSALDALERAVQLGFEDGQHLLEDEDLRSLRGESRFVELVRRLPSATELA